MDAKDELIHELDLLPAWRLANMDCSKLYAEKQRLNFSVFKQIAKISHEYKAQLAMYANLVDEYQTKNCPKNHPDGEGKCTHCENLHQNHNTQLEYRSRNSG